HFDIDCVFDVGANAGQYARMLRQRVGYRGQIVSYEPIPERAATLRAAAAHDLKLDTQGHDLSVATGAGERLRDFVGLQSELAIQRLYDGAPSFEEALEFYRSRGFELSALVPNNLGHFPRLLEIDCIMFRA
ncbi:MAG TPA: hypothetical protein VEK10_04895, partial [Steroidobacteraceae bacterium]|nr:hypothetical protein [Steroidobacteraceae bacterium]